MVLPSTGYSGFDAGLNALFQLNQELAVKIISDCNSVEELLEKLPKEILKTVVALENDELIKMFARANPRQLDPILQSARATSRHLFGKFLNDPKKLYELDQATSEDESVDSAIIDALNRIDNITSLSTWVIADGEITPSQRFLFRTASEKTIIDTTLDWDDTIFLTYRIIQELNHDLDNLSLFSSSQFNLKDKYGDRLAKRLSNMQKDLLEIKNKLCDLGFAADDFGEL